MVYCYFVTLKGKTSLPFFISFGVFWKKHKQKIKIKIKIKIRGNYHNTHVTNTHLR